MSATVTEEPQHNDNGNGTLDLRQQLIGAFLAILVGLVAWGGATTVGTLIEATKLQNSVETIAANQQNLKQLPQRVASLEQAVRGQEQYETLPQRVTTLESDMQSIKEILPEIRQALNDIPSQRELDIQDTRVADAFRTLTARVERFERRVEKRFDDLETRINADP